MNAALLALPNETPETLVSCANCPAVQRLEWALEQLRADFRREVGYWKSQHAKAVKRIEQLQEELDQSRGQVHALQDKLFGRQSEKSAHSGGSKVFVIGHVGPLGNQSATMADVVLGKSCGGWRQGAERHATVIALESRVRPPRGVGGANHVSIDHRYFLTLPTPDCL